MELAPERTGSCRPILDGNRRMALRPSRTFRNPDRFPVADLCKWQAYSGGSPYDQTGSASFCRAFLAVYALAPESTSRASIALQKDRIVAPWVFDSPINGEIFQGYVE